MGADYFLENNKGDATVGTETEIAGPTGPDFNTTVGSENGPEVDSLEICFQMTARLFQSNLGFCPEYTVIMMFRWATTMNQIALISAMVENSFVNGDDPFNAIILCGNVFARKPISDASIGLIMHE